MRQIVVWSALALMLASPAAAQPRTISTADSVWATTLVPLVRPLVTSPRLLAIGADTSRREVPGSPTRSLALAAALADDLGLPGPGTRADSTTEPVCRTSAESAGAPNRSGEVATVLWLPRDTPERGLIAVTLSCRRNGRGFAQGLIQSVVRPPDGTWRADGPPRHWIS